MHPSDRLLFDKAVDLLASTCIFIDAELTRAEEELEEDSIRNFRALHRIRTAKHKAATSLALCGVVLRFFGRI
jgi:hypothetical protein